MRRYASDPKRESSPKRHRLPMQPNNRGLMHSITILLAEVHPLVQQLPRQQCHPVCRHASSPQGSTFAPL